MRVTGCRTAAVARCWPNWVWWGKRRGAITCTGGNRIGDAHSRIMFRENIAEPEISIPRRACRALGEERKRVKASGDLMYDAGIIRPVLDPARDFWE